MSRRWFVSNVGVGAANEAVEVRDGRPLLRPRVSVSRTLGGSTERFDVAGPPLELIGPGDVIGFDRALVAREEPLAGTPNAPAENLACVELTDASLPWQFSRPAADGRPLPWIVLLVLREDEAKLSGDGALPVLEAPAAALPDLSDSWAWAHVEARVADTATGPQADVVADVRSGSQTVISRLLCPRRLAPDSGWIACVVPATNAGVAAGLGTRLGAARPFGSPWTLAQAGTVRLPVYHSWRFRTGPAGSFEDLARRVEPLRAAALAGFGARTIDVRRPWPHADLLEGAPASVTVSVQGALRVPGTEAEQETWSDRPTQERFATELRDRLDAPARRFGTVSDEVDRDDLAVAPPLYGSHFSGSQEVGPGGWQATLNLQVRHRVAAALGTRYVQQEQEFLMARAWEQLGAIRTANKLLSVGELSSEAAGRAQDKHLAGMAATEMVAFSHPLSATVPFAGAGTLGSALARSALPDGTASAAFKRLARPGGGLARRAARVRAATGGGMPDAEPVIAAGLAGQQLLPEAIASVTAVATAEPATVAGDRASLSSSSTLVALMQGQATLFAVHAEGLQGHMATLTAAAETAMGDPPVTLAAPSPQLLRGLRRQADAEALVALPVIAAAFQTDAATAAGAVLDALQPLGQQLTRARGLIAAPDVELRAVTDVRPLRRIMEHPRFGMPIAAELLARWPEWAIPGISGFPPDSATLLETNSPFVEALLVGLNQEFNRELLWREFPTDQRGSAFTRFWPSEVDDPDVDEIARWRPDAALGAHDETGGRDLLVLLVRAELLRRFPGTTVLAAKSVGGLLPDEVTGTWKRPTFLLAIDEQTALFAFDLTEQQARDERWLFVLREPMRGAQFGFDGATGVALDTWADLTWADVPLDGRGFVVPRVVGSRPPRPGRLTGADPAAWGRDAADVARISFQRPFQLAISPRRLLGEPAP